MTKSVTVAPLWGRTDPDPRLDVGKLAHLAPGTTERIIGEMKADQRERIEELERQFNPTPLVMDRHRRLPRPVRTHPSQVATAAPAAAAVAIAPAICPAPDILDGVHPLVRADVLRRAQGDLSRVRVLGPNRVLVLNRSGG